MKLSAVIITMNEEKNIDGCLRSLLFCDEVIVVDSESTDATVSIARRRGAKVWIHPFIDYATQKNYGIQCAQNPWVLSIDADERVTPELAAEILLAVSRPQAKTYFLPRKNRIFGRWMRYSTHRNDYQLRLALKEKAHFSGFVHERIPPEGKGLRLKNPLLHFSTQTIHDYMRKLNCYTNLEVGTLKKNKASFSKRKMIAKPLSLFVYWALIKRGVGDGMEGLFFSLLSAYYEFVKMAKYWERGSQERTVS